MVLCKCPKAMVLPSYFILCPKTMVWLNDMSKTYHGASIVFLWYMLKNMVYVKLHQYIFVKIKRFDWIAPKPTKHKQLLYTIGLTIIIDASFIRCWRNVKIIRITFIIILNLLNRFIPLIYNTTVVHPKRYHKSHQKFESDYWIGSS